MLYTDRGDTAFPHCYSQGVILVTKNNKLTLIYSKAKEMGISTTFVNARSPEEDICAMSREDKKAMETPPILHSWPSLDTREDNAQTLRFRLDSPATPPVLGRPSLNSRLVCSGAFHTWGRKHSVVESYRQLAASLTLPTSCQENLSLSPVGTTECLPTSPNVSWDQSWWERRVTSPRNTSKFLQLGQGY